MRSDKLKVLGFDFVIDFISSIIIITSYILTVDLLNSKIGSNTDETLLLNFLKGAFVFIAPCAIEGVNILTAQKREDKHQDSIEVFLSVIAMFTTAGLVIILFLGNYDFALWFKWLIIVYPTKMVSTCVCDLIHLIKER